MVKTNTSRYCISSSKFEVTWCMKVNSQSMRKLQDILHFVQILARINLGNFGGSVAVIGYCTVFFCIEALFREIVCLLS